VGKRKVRRNMIAAKAAVVVVPIKIPTCAAALKERRMMLRKIKMKVIMNHLQRRRIKTIL